MSNDELVAAREALAAMMMRQGLATECYGDTIQDLIVELEAQIGEMRRELRAARFYSYSQPHG